MLTMFDALRELTFVSVLLRMLLAVACGGVIGLEREYRCRPAGFRTHILICLGAAMTTLTGQYLWEYMHYYTDISRLGAQVVSGIGFMGAGTIIVTRRKRVKGLTTAAGMWTAAIVGLACGLAYYEAAVYTTVLVLLAELIFTKLEYYLMANLNKVSLYVEYEKSTSIDEITNHFRMSNIKVTDMQVTRFAEDEKKRVCAVFSLQMGKHTDYEKVINGLSGVEGVLTVEEL